MKYQGPELDKFLYFWNQAENGEKTKIRGEKFVIYGIINGHFCYEIKIIELGENTDLFFGIISIDNQIFKNKEFRKYPINLVDILRGKLIYIKFIFSNRPM